MNKKAFFGIAVGGLVGILIIIVLYFFFFSNQNRINNPGGSNNSFFPLGDDNDNGVGGVTGDDAGTIPGDDTPQPIPRLRKIASGPVSGYVVFDRKATTTATTTETAIRYVEKATGHVYETTDQTLNTTRLSNTTFPKAEEALFISNQSMVLRTYESSRDTVKSYLGSLVRNTPTSTEYTLKGSYIPDNINQVVTFGGKLFTFYTSAGGSVGNIQNTAGGVETRIFTSPLAGWNIEWINAESIIFQTKPSQNELGYVFILNPITQSFKELLGGKAALMLRPNNDLTRALYTTVRQNSFQTVYRNLKTDLEVQLTSKLFPEKCAWSNSEKNMVFCGIDRGLNTNIQYPDSWYKGISHFNDSIVSIDTDSIKENTLSSPFTEVGEQIDLINPSLSPKDDYLFFMNKNDGSLWSLDLTPAF
jgi:hypothetical protein